MSSKHSKGLHNDEIVNSLDKGFGGSDSGSEGDVITDSEHEDG
jgi:hypothetical protein